VTLVSFERQTIILAQPWHRAGTSCVDRLLCPMLSPLIKMPSCSRGCSQPSFSVRVQRCGLISRLINVLFKSTKMVKSNSLQRLCSFRLWGWGCGYIFSVGRVCVHVGLCFCVYSCICLHVSVCGCLSFGNLLGNLDCMFCNE
jgi:hypothetical protein